MTGRRLFSLILCAWAVASGAWAEPAMPPPPKAGMVPNPCPAPAPEKDFANLCRYAAENAAVGQPKIVFIGDSVTEAWGGAEPELFSNGYVNRGIAGQTTPQLLLRFYQDVVALKPQTVHIQGGTNDIAGNTGPESPQDFKNNIMAMVELAKLYRIRVLLGAIPPARKYDWSPTVMPTAHILELNAWMKAYAKRRGIVFIDYYAALADTAGDFNPSFTGDGVHPNAAGFTRMKVALMRALGSGPKS
ncbi:MAG TPA: GDSL-type esterase/lipase family protein [Alphaproteobacteria bacterium]|nr:GDSL-type esterase/lipase family protein [Alphaproteobacteria bacterium]